MVAERETDPHRIAQLLASELTGLERGPLGAVGVVDADEDASPAPDGALAYRIAVDDDPVGNVELRPETVVVALDAAERTGGDPAAARERARAAADRASDASGEAVGVDVDGTGDDVHVAIRTGAGVKRAVDAVVAVLSPEA